MLLHLRSRAGLEANGHELTAVGRIVLYDGSVGHGAGLQAALKGLEVILGGSEHNGVCAGAQAAWGGFSCCVRDLRGKDATRQIWTDYDVVGDWVGLGGLTVNRA